MAEGRDGAVEKGVKVLEEEITCAVCLKHYTEPKVLPCCHYYCKQCLNQLALRKGVDKPFPCPECRKDTTLPHGGLDNLPTAFFVNRMKEVHSKLELVHGKVEAKCEMCSEDNSETFCRHCAKFMCADCAKYHLKMKKAYPGHKVSTLEELRGGAEDIVIQQPSFQSCDVHEQPMNIYCYDCNSLICRDCTIKDHIGHNYDFVKAAAPKIKQKLLQQLDPLRESCSNMLRAVDGVHTTISEVEGQGKSVTKQIESSFAEFQKIFDCRKQELLTETAMKVKQKCKHLSEQGKGLSIAHAAVESVIDYTEHCIEHSADDQIMCMYTEIQSRINREIEEQQERKDLEPVEKVDLRLEMNCAEDLKQFCQTKAKLTVPDVRSSVIAGPTWTTASAVDQSKSAVKKTRDTDWNSSILSYAPSGLSEGPPSGFPHHGVSVHTRSEGHHQAAASAQDSGHTTAEGGHGAPTGYLTTAGNGDGAPTGWTMGGGHRAWTRAGGGYGAQTAPWTMAWPPSTSSGSHGPQDAPKSSTAVAAKKDCSICLGTIKNCVQVLCGHEYCKGCIRKWLKDHSTCPICQKILQPARGNQPPGGTMTYMVNNYLMLPGYRGCGTIEIEYAIPDGTQSAAHPHPGRRFQGAHRKAYLPNNKEGTEVVHLLRRAFDAGLVFTIGTSHTTGQSDVVVWNDIHHKTSLGSGAFGYPDPTYLRRVKEELAAKGIVP